MPFASLETDPSVSHMMFHIQSSANALQRRQAFAGGRKFPSNLSRLRFPGWRSGLVYCFGQIGLAIAELTG